MELFIAWKTAWDAEDPKMDILSEDAEALRRKNQAMDAAKRIWESWLLRTGGSPIEFNGPDGHATVPANELADLERIRAQVANTLGNGVRLAVGVGIKLSEADQALKMAGKQGGDRIVLYTPPEGDDKVADSPALSKADTAKNPSAAGGGIAGASQAQGPAAAAKPHGEASEHSEAEAELSAKDNAPPSGELTHSAADAEEAFENHADKADDDEQSQKENDGKASADADLKKEVVKVLQHVKAQAPALQQLTATEPKLFAAIQESIRAMLLLAKRVCGGGDAPMQKNEVANYLTEKIQAADKDPVIKSDRLFVKSAFLGKNGRVVTTGNWHDIDQLPEDFEIAEEGFVDEAGNFYDRPTATEMSQPVIKSDQPPAEEIKKTEFKSADGIKIPAKYHPARRAYDKAHVEKVSQAFGQNMDIKPRMVQMSDLATASSGNMVINKSRYNLYRRMLAAGDRLPPIVIRKNGMKYDIIDGSHRVSAVLDHNGHGVNIPQKVTELHALEMTPKPPKLKKSWPKNDQENDANHAAHVMMPEVAMDAGAKYEEHTPFDPGPLTQTLKGKHFDVFNNAHKKGQMNIFEHMANISDQNDVKGQDESGLTHHPRLPALTRDATTTYASGTGVNSTMGGRRSADENDRQWWKQLFSEVPMHPKDEPVGKEEEPMDKAKLPLPENTPTHTEHQYAVGSVKESGAQGTQDVGKIKVQSPETGKTKWRQVRSGLVMGPDGQPVSSRNPSGK